MNDGTVADPASQTGTDEELLAAYAAGDPAAARALTRRLAPRIHAHAMRVLRDRDEAEDIVQEAMLRLWRAAPGWDPSGGARVDTWIWRVAANLCIDRLRRKRRTTDIDAVAEPADPAPGAEARLQAQARGAALAQALAQLPERQALAVTLRHLEGLSNPQIAEIMQIGVEAVESLTARGKRKLAEILGKRRKELGYGTE